MCIGCVEVWVRGGVRTNNHERVSYFTLGVVFGRETSRATGHATYLSHTLCIFPALLRRAGVGRMREYVLCAVCIRGVVVESVVGGYLREECEELVGCAVTNCTSTCQHFKHPYSLLLFS